MPEQLAPSAYAYTPASDDRRSTRRTPESPDAPEPWHLRHWPKIAVAIPFVLAALGYSVRLAFAFAPIPEKVQTLEASVHALQVQADGTETQLTFVSYLLCVNNRGNDPVVLDRCRDIIDKRRKP